MEKLRLIDGTIVCIISIIVHSLASLSEVRIRFFSLSLSLYLRLGFWESTPVISGSCATFELQRLESLQVATLVAQSETQGTRRK